MLRRADGNRRPRVEAAARRRTSWAYLWPYLWAGPTTLVGLGIGLLTLVTRGRGRRQGRVIEVWGGFTTWFLGSRAVRAEAMTLGHVVLGRDPGALERCRDHELAHVRQVERWGPLFLPAYLAASLWAVLTGRHYYRDNWFEVDANRRAPVP